MRKLINRFFMSSLPGLPSRTLVESLDLAIQQAFSKPCLVNLISKDTLLVFYIHIKLHVLLVPIVIIDTIGNCVRL